MANARKYLDALQVQDASNMSGILWAYHRALTEIIEEDAPKVRGSGFYMNPWFAFHPALVLFQSKIMDLGQLFGATVGSINYGNAYDLAKVIEAYPDSEVCPGCHQPIEAAVKTMKVCCCCENWPTIRRIA